MPKATRRAALVSALLAAAVGLAMPSASATASTAFTAHSDDAAIHSTSAVPNGVGISITGVSLHFSGVGCTVTVSGSAPGHYDPTSSPSPAPTT
ncbi:hypothetical protein [Streptomyces sp. NBC_01465]|uniref:hypothetical protein n=1 Tax=Streptomyces sp. NBC_01465 TaxID=2903878 RepID=UPI002E334E87|nr:hypothetical protein [Streptomyces sp. NBC_01465]